MSLEDFDAEPQEVSVAPAPTRAELEIAQTENMRRYRTAKELVVTPEVARALREGWTLQEIADALGVSYQTVLKHVKSAEMGDLADREARRVLRHLASRPLKEEKYRDLAVSLGVLIDKARIIHGEPTEIIRTEGGEASRLALMVFGQAGRAASGNQPIDVLPEPAAAGNERLLDGAESTGQSNSGNDPDPHSPESGE